MVMVLISIHFFESVDKTSGDAKWVAGSVMTTFTSAPDFTSNRTREIVYMQQCLLIYQSESFYFLACLQLYHYLINSFISTTGL